MSGRKRGARPAARKTRVYSPAFVAAVILGVGLNPVNSTLMSTALNPVATGVGVSPSEVTLLVSALYLACAIAQPTAGKLSEQLGPRAVFVVGAWLVIAGGLVGGLATTLAQLVVSRVLIGLGTSCGYPSAMLMARTRARDAGLAEPPAAMLSVLAMVGLVLIAVGPPLGGLLVAALGWRAVFLVNLPVGVLTLAFGYVGLGRDARPTCENAQLSTLARNLDIPGIALFSAFVSTLLWFLLELPRVSWPLLAGSAAALAALVTRELAVAQPFVDVRGLARDASLTLNYVRAMLTMLGAYVVLYALPQWLEDACGLAPQVAGLVIVPMGVVATVCSLAAARCGSSRSQYVVCSCAMAASGALLCLATGTRPAAALAASAVAGATLGLSMSVSQLVLYERAEPEHIGTASGLLRTFIYLGSIGAAALGSIFFEPVVTDAGMHGMGLTVALLGLLSLALTLADRGLRGRGERDGR